MAHAKQTDLNDVDELLSKIRALPFKEKSFGCFYLKSKAVLHFHISSERRYAHVFDGKDWHEVDLAFRPSSKQQALYYKKIYKILPGSKES